MKSSEIVTIAIRAQEAQLKSNIAAARRLQALMEGYTPPPPTWREKVVDFFRECRWRVSAAWRVLRTGECACD